MDIDNMIGVGDTVFVIYLMGVNCDAKIRGYKGVVTRAGWGTYRGKGSRCGVSYGEKHWFEIRTTDGKIESCAQRDAFKSLEKAKEHLHNRLEVRLKERQEWEDKQIKEAEDKIEYYKKRIKEVEIKKNKHNVDFKKTQSRIDGLEEKEN